MKTQRTLTALCLTLSIPLLLAGYPGKDKKKPKHDVCVEGNGQGASLITCGSATTPCEVDIKRISDDSASATPRVADAKDNMPFRVKAGTTIVFKSTSKNTGFVLDFGNSSPFDSGTAIMGGADRPVSVVAKKAGCYTYSVGACTAGTIYGMCGEDAAQLVVSQ
jgi:hypothetical protein